MIEKCQCGNKLDSTIDNEVFFGGILFDSKEDGYADFLALEIEKIVSLTRKGEEKQWFQEKKEEGFPDDISEDTFVYDLLGKAKSLYMDKVIECEQCGMIYVLRGNKTHAYKKID